jgi:hypothetical protein
MELVVKLEALVPPRVIANCASEFRVPFPPEVKTTPLVVKPEKLTAPEEEIPVAPVIAPAPVISKVGVSKIFQEIVPLILMALVNVPAVCLI